MGHRHLVDDRVGGAYPRCDLRARLAQKPNRLGQSPLFSDSSVDSGARDLRTLADARADAWRGFPRVEMGPSRHALLVRLDDLVRPALPRCRAPLAGVDAHRHPRAVLGPELLVGTTVNYREITSLRQVPFLGDTVTVITGVLNPWLPLGYVTTVAILLYVVDASVIAWRRGDRRKALMVGGSVEFFILGHGRERAGVLGQIPMPIIISPLFLGMVTVMGYEVSHDVLRASRLVHQLQVSEGELRESGVRMAMAVDAADLGIWIRTWRNTRCGRARNGASCSASRSQRNWTTTGSWHGSTQTIGIARAGDRRGDRGGGWQIRESSTGCYWQMARPAGSHPGAASNATQPDNRC